MIEVSCHCPELGHCWQQVFVVLPREGETICRMAPDPDSDRLMMLMPRLAVVDIDHHIDVYNGRMAPTIHMYLMVIDEDEDDGLGELVDLPLPREREPMPA